MGRPALRLRRRPGRHDRAHRHLPHGDRREPRSLRRLALSGPGDDGALPDHHLRRRGALPGGRGAGRGGDRRAAPEVVRSLPRGPGRRDRPAEGPPWPRRALRRPLDPLARPQALRGRAGQFQHRDQQRRELRASPGPRRRGGLRGASRLHPRDERAVQGRLDHPPLRAPADGVHALQMELACRGYMADPAGQPDPETWPGAWDAARAEPLGAALRDVITACLAFAAIEPRTNP